jgi:N-acetylglucosaminyldiphosphoundecaprenol N-acetyl-beta-D-mannosaminyltransferase
MPNGSNILSPDSPQPPSKLEVARYNVIGTDVSAIDLTMAASVVDRWIAGEDSHYICVADVHSIMEGHEDPRLRRILNNAGLVTPDGMPLVWLGHFFGHSGVARVYGPDLLRHLCHHGVARGYRHYFYGGDEGVAQKLERALTREIGGIQVCGTTSPSYRAAGSLEDETILDQISAAGPDIVWIGLGAPKQERWMADHVGRIHAPVLIGVGAAFDFIAGTKRQAPLWMQRNGLEWAFRLASEPRRLWRRYLQIIPRFLVLVSLQLLHIRRFEIVH